MSASDPVVVTRPAGQAGGMLRLLARHGYRAVHCPALEIQPITPDARSRHCLMDLAHYHAVFFVSTNAVQWGMDALRDYWPQWPVGVHWLAVGEATAEALAREGVTPQRPERDFNSEAVLALDCLRDLTEKRVLIMRGESGRELLAETLRDRGASVDYIALYRRHCASHGDWPAGNVGAVLVTSAQSWQCLQQTAVIGADTLVVAGSPRIADAVRAGGHDKVASAASPRDEDMLECLNRHLRTT
jgi:uroporphyrinogen-III synthase